MVIVILLAFALYTYELGKQDFWFDEAVSANISGLGWLDAISYLRDALYEHPPIYYLSLYPWQQLAGKSEFAFRFYSVFWGVLFIPLLYALVKRLANERLALLVAPLAVCSPFMAAYSQEARMYTLLPVLAILALTSLWNALERESQPAWWLAYLVLTVVGTMTHYYYALVWVVTALYLFLEFLRKRRVSLWAIAAHGILILVVAVWLVSTSGLRESLLSMGQTAQDFGLFYKLNNILPTLVLAEIQGEQIPLEAYVLATGGWILVAVGAVEARRTRILGRQAWLLLVLLSIVPLIASLFLPWPRGRHLGYVLIPMLTFIALSLVALQRLGGVALTVGTLVLLLLSSYGLVAHYTASKGFFGQGMAYIDEQGQTEDAIILTHPHQWPLATYYNDKDWPVHYIPPDAIPPTPAQVAKIMQGLDQAQNRLWLGPAGAWTADPEFQTERWLSTQAYQAEKIWFPDSSSVALYFTADEGLAALDLDLLTWEGQIRLNSAWASPLQIPAGDAIRLSFNWRAGFDLDERYAVTLSLQDDQGDVWAERHSEPCSGWCPTDTWRAGHLVHDQHALVIPPGTPPDTYDLAVTWTPLDGRPPLLAEKEGQRVEQVVLAQVAILPADDRAGAPGLLPNPLQARFGNEITLLGYEPLTFEALPGVHLHLETHWLAETTPAADYDLMIELTDSGGRWVANWQVSPASDSYPTSKWQAGEYWRGKHDLTLPSTLQPGRYELRLALVGPSGERLSLGGERPRQALGGLLTWQERLQGQDLALVAGKIVDRPRQFILPDMAHSLGATVGRHAHLMGYDLDLSQVRPGGQILLTLFWQADGPMVRPFKVFTHLVTAEGEPLAQHDGPPGQGCCPTNTWTKGEVIVDEHQIDLGVDLLPGTYQLVAGMYDEEMDTRLPSYSADGAKLEYAFVPVHTVTIEPIVATGQQTPAPNSEGPPDRMGPLFDLEYSLFFPMIRLGRIE